MKCRAAIVTIALVVSGTLAGPSTELTAGAQSESGKPLQIYVVDTEGGKATLFVSPTGQTALLDSGCRSRRPGWRTRDAGSTAHPRVLDQDHRAAGWLVHVSNSRNGYSKTYTARPRAR